MASVFDSGLDMKYASKQIEAPLRELLDLFALLEELRNDVLESRVTLRASLMYVNRQFAEKFDEFSDYLSRRGLPSQKLI